MGKPTCQWYLRQGFDLQNTQRTLTTPHQEDKPKVRGFNSQSGHTPRLQVRSPVRVGKRGNRSMFLSLSLSLSPPFPLSLSLLSIKLTTVRMKNKIKQKLINLTALKLKNFLVIKYKNKIKNSGINIHNAEN